MPSRCVSADGLVKVYPKICSGISVWMRQWRDTLKPSSTNGKDSRAMTHRRGRRVPVSRKPARTHLEKQEDYFFFLMASTTAVLVRRFASLTEMNRPVLASLPT